MNPELLSAAAVFAVAFCSILLLWQVKGGRKNKHEEAMLIALNRVRGITPAKTVAQSGAKSVAKKPIKRTAYEPARQ